MQLGVPNTICNITARQSKATAKQSKAMPIEAKPTNAKQRKAKQIKAMQRNAKQSKAKQSKANQSHAKQSKSKQHFLSVNLTRSRGGDYYCCSLGSCILLAQAAGVYEYYDCWSFSKQRNFPHEPGKFSLEIHPTHHLLLIRLLSPLLF